MKQLLSVTFIYLLTHQTHAAGYLAVRGGTWSFATQNVRSADESSSGIGAYAFEINYAVSQSWMVLFGFNLIMSDIYAGSAGYGFDLGGKYYPLTSTGTQNMSTENAEVSIQESWRPYFAINMRQRIFGLAISTSYLGPGLSLGLDYSIGKSTFLSAEMRYDYLYGQGDALAVQNNILLGLGIEF